MGMLEHVSKIPHGSANLGRAACRKPEASDCSNIEGSQHEPATVSRKRRSRRSSFSPSGPNTARRRAETRWFDAPPTRSPLTPLRRFKKALRSENVAKFGRRRGRVGWQLWKNFMPPGPLEYTGCLGSTGQPSAPIAVE